MNYQYHFSIKTRQVLYCSKASFLAISTSDLSPYLSFRSSQLRIFPRSTMALIRRLTSLCMPFIYIPQAQLQRPTGIYRQRVKKREEEVIKLDN